MDGDQRIDPRQASFFTRPDYFDVLARLRDEDPVHGCDAGFWALTRYEDIRDVSRDPSQRAREASLHRRLRDCRSTDEG